MGRHTQQARIANGNGRQESAAPFPRGLLETCTEAQCMELDAELYSAAELRHLLREMCAKSAVDEDSAGELELAAVEAFNNGVQHGVQPGCGRIRACVCVSDQAGAVELQYPGAPFDPTPPRLPDPLAQRGRGRYVMTALTDRVEYEFRDGLTWVRLHKHWRNPGSGVRQ